MNRVHKRFTAFLLSLGALTLIALIGKPEIYGIFAGAVSGCLTLYVGGQSGTDYVKAKNGAGSN